MKDNNDDRNPEDAQAPENSDEQDQNYEGGEEAVVDPPSTDPGDVPGPGKGP